MSGNLDARGKVREFLENKKSQGKIREFCCVKFFFGKSEHLNFENFPGEHAPRPPLTVLDTHKNLIMVWKSHGKVKEFHPFWRPDTLIMFMIHIIV